VLCTKFLVQSSSILGIGIGIRTVGEPEARRCTREFSIYRNVPITERNLSIMDYVRFLEAFEFEMIYSTL